MVTHENDIEYQNNIRGGKKKESWYDFFKKSLRTQDLGASVK